MFRSSVYLSSLTLACALFYLGSATPAQGQLNLPPICTNTTVTIPQLPANFPRVSSTQKGSIVMFSKIELKWAADGSLIQDTFLDLTNDYPADVYLQGYFINGDRVVPEVRDAQGQVLVQYEAGWNTADCRFQLTGNQPVWWSAARGGGNCQAFTILDPQGPGRPDPETGGSTRVLRGYAIFWAVAFDRNVPPTGAWHEINWNHLKGDAVIVNYANGAAWEYNGWSFQAIVGARGEFLPTPGALVLGREYEAAYADLVLDFYGSSSTVLSTDGNPSGDVTAMLDTDLTLHPIDLDLRQDGCGPVLTKARAIVCNENEVCFSGLERCVCCWDSTAMSLWAPNTNTFLRSFLGTDKGKATISGIDTGAAVCNYETVCGIDPLPRKLSPKCGQLCDFATTCPGPGCANFLAMGFAQASPLLGVAVKRIAYSPGAGLYDMAGMNIHGKGREPAVILTDIEYGPSEIRKDTAGRTVGAR